MAVSAAVADELLDGLLRQRNLGYSCRCQARGSTESEEKRNVVGGEALA